MSELLLFKVMFLILFSMQFSMFFAGLPALPDMLPYPSGDGEIRTHDPLLARQVLSQLSYTPVNGLKWTRTTDLALIRRAL